MVTKAFYSSLRAYFQPRLIAVMLLGFVSGLPYLLVGSTLGARLLDAGLDIKTIGLFALVALPYSFNFLWAPFLDHVRLPILTCRMGRRRGWLIVIQLLLLLAIWLLAGIDPAHHAETLAAVAVAVAFLSASQDVVIDAFRAEYLERTAYGEGAAMAVFGYRLGMLGAGAGALALADAESWGVAYSVMALTMGVGIFTTLCVREPEMPQADAGVKARAASEGMVSWLKYALITPFADFASRHPYWWLLLLLILFYRMPDGFVAFITTPFFLSVGFEKTEVAAVAKLYGFGATLLGMFLGGALLHRWGVKRCLWWFLWFQMLANAGYALLSLSGESLPMLMLTISLDNCSGGMVTAAAIAYMMSLCNLQFTATQYALLSSLASLASKTIASSAGYIAEWVGWAAMFGLSALLGLPALIMLYYLRSHPSMLEHPQEKDTNPS